VWKRRRPEIQLKSVAELRVMRDAGLVVARTLERLRAAVAPGVSTADLDALAEESIRKAGAVPSFKGYHGFPATICTSVNEAIVHGIPNPRIVLRAGDIISIDCGAIVNGWHGDAAITVGVGEIAPELTRLLRVCEDALWRGLAAGRRGGALSDIGHAVEQHVRAQGRYGLVEEYVGHGIGTEMHMEPSVPNYGAPGRGPRLREGMSLAVEPMINMGTRYTRLLDDGWTVKTADGRPSAHFEHTFAVTRSGPWVLTALDGGRGRLGRLGVAVSDLAARPEPAAPEPVVPAPAASVPAAPEPAVPAPAASEPEAMSKSEAMSRSGAMSEPEAASGPAASVPEPSEPSEPPAETAAPASTPAPRGWE
jgi:methionyl aminopeptidase